MLQAGSNPLGVDRFPGTEPRIIVVHGVLDRAATFRRVARALAPRAVLLYDRRGYARSRSLGAAGLDVHLQDLRELVAEGPCVVVGHSLGGTLALALAAEAPRTLGAASVFEAPLPSTAWWGPWPFGPEDVLAGRVEETSLRDATEDFLRRQMGPQLARLGPAFLAERRAEAAAFTRELAELASGAFDVDLARVAVPVQAGIGEFATDRHRRGLEAVVRETGAEAYCVRGAPHGVHLRQPEAFAAAIANFVDRRVTMPTS